MHLNFSLFLSLTKEQSSYHESDISESILLLIRFKYNVILNKKII